MIGLRWGLWVFVSGVSLFAISEDPPQSPAVAPSPPTSQTEAKVRARLLFETINGSLQVMHRDFFDDDNAFAIPSRSLEDVFIELNKSQGVKVKWLTVNADTLNIDHDAETEFEHAAVKTLSTGEKTYESIDESTYHYAGAIQLRSECLKCHVRRRSSNEARISALTIAIPVTEMIETPKTQDQH
ncbi:hypothetical protein Q31b_10080 [Novipirellula aureliae]|uniref:Tll0287-like domain-containing protein n=2 Tax=Novipirellula aureliae TaxID=2527966 RepID=A0A5C6E9Z4_9BACT|nr:hypothetical protein Q31b_10080 [Novipirellula aureliae]